MSRGDDRRDRGRAGWGARADLLPAGLPLRLVRRICLSVQVGLAVQIGLAASGLAQTPPAGAVPEAAAPAAASATVSPDATIAADFAAVTAAAAHARQTLQPLETALDALAGRNGAAGRDPGFARAREGIERHREALARFVALAALAPSWRDLGHELGHLATTVRPADVDALAAAVGSAAGAEVRAALAAYRQAVGAVAAAVGPLRDRVAAARERDRLAGEARGGKVDPRYRALIAQHGETLADASVYVPSSPPELYRPNVAPAEKVYDVALVWDEAEDEWHRLPGDVPVEDIFRDVFLATGKRPTPGQLKTLAGIHAQIRARTAAVDALAGWLDTAATGDAAAAQAMARASGGAATAREALREPWRLRARYAYDATYRTGWLAGIDAIRRDLVGQGAAGATALQSLDAVLARHGLTLASQWDAAVPPAKATLKVTAWFRDEPKARFVSLWHFDKELVRIEIDQGRATGVRRGNLVESEGSIPGRNCVASDSRTFLPNGTLSFAASYRCVRADGAIEAKDRVGAGTWEVVPDGTTTDAKPSDAKPSDQSPAAEPKPEPRRRGR